MILVKAMTLHSWLTLKALLLMTFPLGSWRLCAIELICQLLSTLSAVLRMSRLLKMKIVSLKKSLKDSYSKVRSSNCSLKLMLSSSPLSQTKTGLLAQMSSHWILMMFLFLQGFFLVGVGILMLGVVEGCWGTWRTWRHLAAR